MDKFKTVIKEHPTDDFVDELVIAEATPLSFAFATEFVDQSQGCFTRAAPFGLA